MITLRAENLKKKYLKKEVIKGIHFDLPANTCIALLGANGAGKTTILQMLAGIIHPTEGQIIVNGSASIKKRRTAIGYLPQNPAFFDWMTGLEYLIYSTRLTGATKKAAYDRALSLLEIVGLGDAGNNRIAQYSGGMRQRLGIAQAITHQPDILLLDEPVSALDPVGRREVLTLFQQLKKHTTVFYSTHILHDAEEVSDEIIFLDRGQIVEGGSLQSLKKKYKKNKLSIVFEEDMQVVMAQLQSAFPFFKMESEGQMIHIFSEDCYAAQQLLMKEVLARNWRTLKLEISSTSLEEMFLKVADQK
ncbi:ABC transporter ATP-binding protein [Bacillus mesophilum]|uniref:ABC transporter ATP-binding protein n=1 Tax=Bacillus mesophilum TaxID=1071718 RepID=A0A7V7RMJ2_9BACI|nr:ABC transporter ATP-binding protein [Bacillus mesophilum]KAB2333524.1 ABC transporter ATP-binding protein [Bacillus mesophilum]